MSGNWSPEFLNRMKGFEGFSATPKWDYKQSSWGYGTRAPANATTITPEQAEQELVRELDKAHGYVAGRFPKLNQNQAEALTDLTYNAGPEWMKDSGLARAVDAGDAAQVQEMLRLYVNAGGKPLDGLRERRNWAAEHYAGTPAAPGAAAPVQVASAEAPAMAPPSQAPAAPTLAATQAPPSYLENFASQLSGDAGGAPSEGPKPPPLPRPIDLPSLRKAINPDDFRNAVAQRVRQLGSRIT
jgi:lysozyme